MKILWERREDRLVSAWIEGGDPDDVGVGNSLIGAIGTLMCILSNNQTGEVTIESVKIDREEEPPLPPTHEFTVLEIPGDRTRFGPF